MLAAAAFGKLNKGVQKTGAKAKGVPATGGAAKGQPKSSPISASGFRGVTKTPNNRWVVRFKHQGKPIRGEVHATAEEAALAQDKLRQELGYTEPGFFNFQASMQ